MFRNSLSLLLWIAIMMASEVRAQANTPIYADYREGDSIQMTTRILSSELAKANIQVSATYPLSAFKGSGIVIATSSQAGRYNWNLPSKLNSMGPEGIWVSGTGKNVYIVANSSLALVEAIYFYLEQLGYRWYLPGDAWKIVPRISSPFKNITILTKPDFEYRWISNGHAYGNSKKIADDFNSWAAANRLGGSFPVRIGHSYEEIVQRNADLFKKHPEYFGQSVAAGTIPSEFKFNVANKTLVDFLVQDAFYRYEAQIRSGEPSKMISMEPSDGGKYCQTPECKAIGSPSDQAFYLSNIVARAFQKKYPGAWVGGYAYNEHILPTKYKLEPNIFVTITNGFNRTKYSTEELLRMWKQKATKVGVYDYTSVYEWDMDMPGQVTAAKTAYLKKSVKNFYNAGASVYLAESCMGWVNKGPGQYILSKLLWNRNASIDSLLDDFYLRAYEDAAPLVRKLYKSWENYAFAIPADNDMADWLQWIDEAYKATNSTAVKRRIDQLKMYMHYVVLYRELKKNKTEENLMRVMSYAYRTFDETAFATLPTLVSLPFYNGFKGQGWYDIQNPKWKEDKRPVSNGELQQNFYYALRSIKKTEGVTTQAKATAFVKLSSVFNIPTKKYASGPHAPWFKTEYIIQIGSRSNSNRIQMRSDFSAQLPVDKPVTIKLYPFKPGQMDDETVEPLLQFEQSSKNTMETFSLGSLQPGTYRMVVDDQRKVFILNFSESIHYSTVASNSQPVRTTSVAGLNTYYFFVPAGTRRFQVTKTNGFLLESPSGRKIDKQLLGDETFFVDVRSGENGIWTISMQGGLISLEGIPPYLGDNPYTMLIPSNLKN